MNIKLSSAILAATILFASASFAEETTQEYSIQDYQRDINAENERHQKVVMELQKKIAKAKGRRPPGDVRGSLEAKLKTMSEKYKGGYAVHK